MLEVQIFTLYPDLYPGLLDVGIYKEAKEKQKWSLKIIDIRDYAFDDNRTVDDTPFGGGSGMLLKPDVVASALDKNIKAKEKIIYLSPKGKKLDQQEVKSLSKLKKINKLLKQFKMMSDMMKKMSQGKKIPSGMIPDEMLNQLK